MLLDVSLIALAFASAAFAGAFWQRTRLRRNNGSQTARYVEAERIIAMLSARQPGVWDQEDLRERVQKIARDFWSLPTREAFSQLQSWVNPALLKQTHMTWPGRSERREVTVKFTAPVAFMQVNEGGPGPDRLIARLTAQLESAWFDAKGKVLKKERQRVRATYHTWIHIDGQGWQLDAIADAPPAGEPPPSSVSCRILPQDMPGEPATREQE
jgi:hypothetical protein